MNSSFEDMTRDELIKEIAHLKNELNTVEKQIKDLQSDDINQEADLLSKCQNELFNQVVENIKGVFWLYDVINDKTLYVSSAFKSIWGVPIDDLKNASKIWTNGIHEDDRKAADLYFSNLFSSSKKIIREYRVVRPDGEIRWILDRGWAIYNEKNEIVKLAGVAEDITDRMVTENELIQSEKKFRSVFEDSHDCIFLSDPNGKINDINTAGLKLFEMKRTDVVGKDFSIFFDDQTKFEMFNKMIFDSGFVKDFRTNFIKKDKVLVECKLTAFARHNEKSEIIGYQGIIRDITLESRYEKELIKAKEEAERANDLKTEFLTQISHEIRTPINTLLSFSSLIREEIKDDLSEQLNQYFGYQVSAGSRIVNTIDSILNMSELQTGTFKTNYKKVNLLDVLNFVYAEYVSIAEANHLELKLLTSGNIFPVYVDEYSIHQVFRNLIDNSIKYTSSGEITLSVFEKKDEIRVEIVDTGIGMTEEYMKILYQPFTQEEQGYTRSYEGSGLGLALVKKYCDLNKVRIKVDSKKGEGTKFTLLFSMV